MVERISSFTRVSSSPLPRLGKPLCTARFPPSLPTKSRQSLFQAQVRVTTSRAPTGVR